VKKVDFEGLQRLFAGSSNGNDPTRHLLGWVSHRCISPANHDIQQTARTASPGSLSLDVVNANSKPQRYAKRKQVSDRMKLHLRTITQSGFTYRLVTLRPYTEAAFSTNFFHQTWHLLSDQHGARLLARLMWGLSFQRHAGTAVVIHGEHIKPTPFGAERSDPILLTLADASTTDRKRLARLHRRLSRLGPSERTIRWHTFSMDSALQDWRRPIDHSVEHSENDWMNYQQIECLRKSEQMFRRGGFVCYSAPPQIMRLRALMIATLDPQHYGMDYLYLAEHSAGHWPDGEVQIFSDYHQRRSAAAAARREVLHESRGAGRTFDGPDSLYTVVANRREMILRNRRASHQKSE